VCVYRRGVFSYGRLDLRDMCEQMCATSMSTHDCILHCDVSRALTFTHFVGCINLHMMGLSVFDRQSAAKMDSGKMDYVANQGSRKTCYMNAAAVMVLRVLCRVNGIQVPTWKELCDEMCQAWYVARKQMAPRTQDVANKYANEGGTIDDAIRAYAEYKR
jgi:hypothetical protein